MVDTLNPLACCSLNSMASPPASRETYENQQAKLIPAKPMESGLGVENQISTPVKAELFS